MKRFSFVRLILAVAVISCTAFACSDGHQMAATPATESTPLATVRSTTPVVTTITTPATTAVTSVTEAVVTPASQPANGNFTCDIAGNHISIPVIGVCAPMDGRMMVNGVFDPNHGLVASFIEGFSFSGQPDMSWIKPGQSGAAVIAGHVNYNGVDGVFARLTEVKEGAEIVVTYGGTDQHYRVFASGPRPKKAELSELVDGVTATRIVVMTCTGDFDPNTGSYYDNYILQADKV